MHIYYSVLVIIYTYVNHDIQDLISSFRVIVCVRYLHLRIKLKRLSHARER